MEEFLNAVAQSLQNLGFEDAVATPTYVEVCEIRFQVRHLYSRNKFQFCGRIYRSGNTLVAVLDLIKELPHLLAQREKELRLKTINKSFEEHGLCISLAGDKYMLTYTADLDRLEVIAKQIASEQAIIFASLDNELSKYTTIFTSEGGFYHGN